MWPQVVNGTVGNVLNVLINYIFLYPLKLGVAGSAAPSLTTCWLCFCVFTSAGGVFTKPHGECPLGFSVAATVRVGNALGAGNIKQTRLSCKVSIICAFIVVCFVGVGINITRKVIGFIFTSDQALLQEFLEELGNNWTVDRAYNCNFTASIFLHHMYVQT
ncbi:hypothetical protein AMECASPLE_006861 [Ameca splendens]|uniref:Uncharacterized protein n=1 Tax=Ameca splendens TaxID=208324 RepID=A0ABV0YY26_9TELE